MKKAKISIAVVMSISLIISIIINEYYLNLISLVSKPADQQAMFLDAYYYFQQGAMIYEEWGIPPDFDLFYYNSPTLNSTGVVFISSILSSAGFNAHSVPLFMGFIYSILILNKNFNPDILPTALIFLGLCPLAFITSKEAFLYIAFLLMFQAYYSSQLKSLIYFLLSLTLFAIARYEILAILLVGFFLMFADSKYKLIFSLIILTGLILLNKEIFFAGPLQLESSMASISGLVHGGDNEYTLLSSDNNLAVILVARLFYFLLLPVKWGLNAVSLFNTNLNFHDVINISSQFLFIFFYFFYFVFFIKLKNLRAMYSCLKEFRWLCSVTFLYSFYYGIFVFHQPTRQIIFILSIFLFFTSAIKNRNQNMSLICRS